MTEAKATVDRKWRKFSGHVQPVMLLVGDTITFELPDGQRVQITAYGPSLIEAVWRRD